MLPLLASGLVLVGMPVPAIDMAGLQALPAEEVTAHLHGTDVTCRGPRLAAVLAAAGVPQGKALRGPALRQAVLAQGADGYGVLFSLGELDPLLGKAPVIVATSCVGAAPDAADGPLRILSGGDSRGARSVRQLVRLQLLPPAP